MSPGLVGLGGATPNRRRRRAGLTAAALSLLAVTTFVCNPVATAHAQAPELSDTLVTTLPYTALSEVAAPNGNVIDTWNVAGVPVAATAPPGSVVQVGFPPPCGAQPLSELPPCVPGPSVSEPGAAVSGGAPPAKLPSTALVASVTPPSILKSALDVDPTYQQVFATSGRILDSYCVELKPDGGYSRACNIQTLDQDQGNGDWYIADQMQMTGGMQNLWKLAVHVEYSNDGNSVVHWAPDGWFSTGSCTTQHLGINGNNASYSEDFQDCPDGFGPYFYTAGFGAYWRGSNTSQSRGVDAVDYVHSPPQACNCQTLYAEMDWSS